jgi:hypothetical protein
MINNTNHDIEYMLMKEIIPRFDLLLMKDKFDTIFIVLY